MRSIGPRNPALVRWKRRVRWAKAAALVVVAAPLFQVSLCFPDVLGAVNFEAQNFINRIIFTIVDSLVRNVLNL